MPILPQCHHGNPQVDYQNIHHVISIDYPIVTTGIHKQDIHQVISNPKYSIQHKNFKEQDSIHHKKDRGEKHHMIHLY